MLLKKAERPTTAGEPLKGDERLVRLTEPAGRKCTELMQRDGIGKLLRVAINGGGCNGLSYRLNFVDTCCSADIEVASAGVRVVVDTRSALYLRGTVIDYSDSLMAGGFKFTNPNAKASCSCGESFSV
jgi:iron-sulfur cluster assembly protein